MTMPRELHVYGLPRSMTTDRLTTIFAQAGSVLSARVVIERRSPRGRGFVTMRSTADAQRAVRQLDDQELEGGVLSVEMAPRVGPEGLSAASVVVSFLVGARAFHYLVDRLESLQSSAATAVTVARGRGCVAGCYYFLDVPDDVVRDVRNCLQRMGRGSGGRACVVAAGAIEDRRRAAWYSSPCPRCGGRFRPQNGLTSGTLMLVCRECEVLMPG